MRQKNNKTITEYVVRLKEQTEFCKFKDNRQDRILEHLIQTTEDNEMIKKKKKKKNSYTKTRKFK